MTRIISVTFVLAAIALAGCSKVESDWNAAVEENTITAYEAHLANFPDTPHAAAAQTAITQLEWQAAKSANSVEALEGFIESHPGAPQLDVARESLEMLYTEIREADLADMGEKLRAFLDGDESANVIAKIGGQAFVPRAQQPQSGIIVHSGSQMMAVIGGAAKVVYVAGPNNTVASVEDYEFAIGAPIEMTNGNRYAWRDGGWEADD
jgi:hypothetical protein